MHGMVRNTPRKRAPWRSRIWVRWHNRHGQVIRKTLATESRRDDGWYLSSQKVDVCGRGHMRDAR